MTSNPFMCQHSRLRSILVWPDS